MFFTMSTDERSGTDLLAGLVHPASQTGGAVPFTLVPTLQLSLALHPAHLLPVRLVAGDFEGVATGDLHPHLNHALVFWVGAVNAAQPEQKYHFSGIYLVIVLLTVYTRDRRI